VNEHGIEDLAGNVWEWTSTCFVRSRMDAAGNAGKPTVNCGVRVAEGAHRAYVTDFIRDARAGGCAQGVPPANLGFRLVREEPSWVASVSARWGKVWAARS
jgi:formylglycine-generating enzyme required for sulfatase activity